MTEMLGPLRRVILQSTSFCNIDCRYCYLPDRDKRRVMPIEVVAATADLLAGSEILADEVEIRWHAGEPLTAPIQHYRESAAILLDALGPECTLQFSVQTNGMMIRDDWCDLFDELDIRVGVSIDGPPEIHDAHRLTRQGRGTYARAMQGVDVLRRRNIPFEVISVVTETTLRHTDAYLAFLRDLAPANVGINPEETEGSHTSELFRRDDFADDYRQFLARLLSFQKETGIPVRRLARMQEQVRHARLPLRNDQVEPLMLLSVDIEGNVSTFSPELMGWAAPAYGDYILGNVRDPGLGLTDWTPGFHRLAADIAAGRDLCAAECEYFALCGGGAAVNKWTENGTFVSTRTRACESNVMAVVDVVLAALEQEAVART